MLDPLLDLRLRDLHFFDRLAVLGSLSRVAAELGLPRSTASRWLGELEGRLGVTLARRTTRAWVLTPAGEELARRGRQLDTVASFSAPEMSFPNGCHVCEVEIDRETGALAVVGYTAVDDVGTVIHETIVDGQTHGGIAQGLGQVLGEHMHYGENGQLLNASFMDYPMPRADSMPSMTTALHAVPCTTNPLGVKGAGESGVAGSLPSAMNAIIDALAGAGIEARRLAQDVPGDRQPIGDRLAGAGLRRDQEIAAGRVIGQHRRLHGRRLGVVALGQGLGEGRACRQERHGMSDLDEGRKKQRIERNGPPERNDRPGE